MGMMERESKSWKYNQAKRRVKKVKNFYIHLAAFLFVNAFVILLNTRHQGVEEFLKEGSVLKNLTLWGIVLIIHWSVVLGAPLLLGSNWEKRKLKELMEKERNNV